MIRGVYSVRDEVLRRGFFTNSVPALFQHIGRVRSDEYAFFELVSHCSSTGAYGNAENRVTVFGEGPLIERLAERLGVDPVVLESELDRTLSSPPYSHIGSVVEGLLASRVAPDSSVVRELRASGLGYVEYDPSELVITAAPDIARYAAK